MKNEGDENSSPFTRESETHEKIHSYLILIRLKS